MSLKIIFMGTPEFSVPTLDALVKNNSNIINVYTQPPRKSKRGLKINISPVELFAKKNNLKFRSPDNLFVKEEYNFFNKLSADLVIVVAYGNIIPKNFLKCSRLGFINLHASLLPKWRGAAPIHRAIMNGDKKTGISIMKIEEKLDTGPTLVKKELELKESSTYDEVEKKLSKIGAELLIENLKIIETQKAQFEDQNHLEATYAKKINKNECKVNWNLDANKVISHIHGLSSLPGAWFSYKKLRFKILKAKKSEIAGKPGVVLDEHLTIGCKKNSVQILEIQREGKNRQNVKDFLLGNKIIKGTTLD